MVASIQSSAQGLILHANSWIYLRRQHKAQESTRTIHPLNTQAPQTPSGQRRHLTMEWGYSQSFNAFTPHASRDGLASESEAPMDKTSNSLRGAQESQERRASQCRSDDRMSPTSAGVLSNVEAQAKQWKDQRRNRQNSWSIVD